MKKSFLVMLLVLFTVMVSKADGVAPLRRPVDVNRPMFIIHIDTWNYPDPEKIINLIPEDIRPWCVFNVSLSISHNETTGQFNLVRNGYETAKSWVRACAEKNVWCTVQPASGGFSHLPDCDMTIYEEFFRDYPNFLGFNYCEQFWGFNDKFSVTVPTRLEHFKQLMELSIKYGGYLIVSWCGGIWHFDTDPVAMMKRKPELQALCKAHPENFVLLYKYTSAACWYNNESVCLGTFISGLTDNYGVRFDQCGWDSHIPKDSGQKYPTAAGIAPVLENTQLTGATVFDGPELIWQQCFKGVSDGTTSDGYKTRRYARYDQFDNIWVDMYRKILDGTLRIPTRHEVMDKTQLVIFQDVKSGNSQAMYATPNNLYDGLYKMDGEGNLQENTSWFKKTGRYGAIPVVTVYNDLYAANIPIRIKMSQFSSRWKTVQDKVDELNKYAPEESTGDLYVGRMKNAWVAYNPVIYGTMKTSTIPFKYNTCEKMELSLNEYSAALIHEYEDSIKFYFNNYRVDTTNLKIDSVRIYGCAEEPVVTVTDRARHQKSNKQIKWENGVSIIKVAHCGAVDVKVECRGNATGRLSTEGINDGRKITVPAAPPTYYGPRQHEAECFDYKNVGRMVTNPGYAADNGNNPSMDGHFGQGYLEFGTNGSAIVKDTINVPVAGKYRLKVRYCAPYGESKHVMLLVNTTSIMKSSGRFNFAKTEAKQWVYDEKEIDLKAGNNVIYLRANVTNSTPAINVLIDNIVVEMMPVTGDVDGDGLVTMADANMIVNHYLGVSLLTGEALAAADMDGDGLITMADANAVVNIYIGAGN